MMKSILTTFALLIAGTTAQAATVTYDLTGNTATLASFSQTASGLSVSASATGGNIHRNVNGFGVTGNPNQNRIGIGEVISFTFNAAINGFSATIFETGSENERFGVTINGVSTNYTVAGGTNGTSFINFNFDSLMPTTGVTTVAIFGREPNVSQSNRGIRIQKITATTVPVTPPPPVAPVPLPASGLLLLGGLCAMKLRRR